MCPQIPRKNEQEHRRHQLNVNHGCLGPQSCPVFGGRYISVDVPRPSQPTPDKKKKANNDKYRCDVIDFIVVGFVQDDAAVSNPHAKSLLSAHAAVIDLLGIGGTKNRDPPSDPVSPDRNHTRGGLGNTGRHWRVDNNGVIQSRNAPLATDRRIRIPTRQRQKRNVCHISIGERHGHSVAAFQRLYIVHRTQRLDVRPDAFGGFSKI